MANDDNGLNLFDETASAAGNFPVALRGYDRASVDDYVRSLEANLLNTRRQVYDLEEQVSALNERLDAHAAAEETEELNYTNLGGRATDILRLAEEQAREVTERATVDAQKLRESARREADTIRRSAERDGHAIRTNGLTEIQELRERGAADAAHQLEKVTTEAAAILAAARREAELATRAAEQGAQTLRQTTYLDTEGHRRAVEKEVADLRQQVAAEREQAIAQLRGTHQEAVERTAALLAEATQHATESRERLEVDVAESGRIRAEALAEAERVKLAATQQSEERITAATKQAAAITERTQQEFAWRQQQLRRETDLLSQRKQAVLNQLASLSALAAQTAQTFPDLEDLDDDGEGDHTVRRPADRAPALPRDQADDTVSGQVDEDTADRGPTDYDDTPDYDDTTVVESAAANRDRDEVYEDPDATLLFPAVQLPPSGRDSENGGSENGVPGNGGFEDGDTGQNRRDQTPADGRRDRD